MGVCVIAWHLHGPYCCYDNCKYSVLVGEECGVVTHSRGAGCQFHEFETLLFLARLCFCYRWTSNKNIDVVAVHLLKGKQVDLQLPGVMYMYLD